VVTFTSRPLYPGSKGLWNLLDKRMGVLQNQPVRGSEAKNTLAPVCNRTPIFQPIT